MNHFLCSFFILHHLGDFSFTMLLLPFILIVSLKISAFWCFVFPFPFISESLCLDAFSFHEDFVKRISVFDWICLLFCVPSLYNVELGVYACVCVCVWMYIEGREEGVHDRPPS